MQTNQQIKQQRVTSFRNMNSFKKADTFERNVVAAALQYNQDRKQASQFDQQMRQASVSEAS